MRVVAGSARGRPLEAPPGRAVRPTTDRVREAVFNALNSMGAIEGATVLDLFAGSGAMGIEALSRGAASATFVDRSRSALEVVRRNLARAGLADRAEVVQAESLAFLREVGTSGGLAPSGRWWNLAVADPPYAFDGWRELLDLLPAERVVIESDRAVEPSASWAVVRVRTYGATVVTVAEGHPPPPSGGPTS
jgi:16S rRNA (guanine966-N2)-methyltransferase